MPLPVSRYRKSTREKNTAPREQRTAGENEKRELCAGSHETFRAVTPKHVGLNNRPASADVAAVTTTTTTTNIRDGWTLTFR